MERREKRFASRILAWFLTFLMITTMIPTSAFAALPGQDTGAVVSEDASSDETTQDGILLKTTLTDKLKVKGQRKLFDVWARDAEDNTLKPTATLDGQVLSATWSDNVKTSFTLDFQGMEEKEHRKHRLIPLFIRKPKKANLSVMQRSALKPLQSQKVIS